MIELERSSELAASPERVWSHASTMAGVNAELRPWLRMSVAGNHDLSPRAIEPPGEFVFASWLLLGGVIPFDRHALHLEAVDPEQRWFHERSRSWLQREWIHHRRVEPSSTGGCRLTDKIRCTPRIKLSEPITRRLVAVVFDHRHTVLRRLFA